MVEGVNFITDEKGKQKGIILDLLTFKKNDIKASQVIDALSELQELIDNVDTASKKVSNWDLAKENLKSLHP